MTSWGPIDERSLPRSRKGGFRPKTFERYKRVSDPVNDGIRYARQIYLSPTIKIAMRVFIENERAPGARGCPKQSPVSLVTSISSSSSSKLLPSITE